jgi:alpha-aminoadipate/glutamate carrier protein LysW
MASGAVLFWRKRGDNNMATLVATCPECGGDVPAETVERGEILPCPDCGAQLEVRATAPLTLTLAPEIQEDWGE